MLHIGKILKNYFLVSSILLLMIGLSIYYIRTERADNLKVIRNNIVVDNESKEQKSMDITIILTILSTVGILAGVWKNPKVEKLTDIFKDFSRTNKADHDDIRSSIKKFQYNYDLDVILQETIDTVLELTSGELTTFIVDEGKRFKDFAKDVISGGLYASSTTAIMHKAKVLSMDSEKAALQLGDEFAKQHKKSQEYHVKIFAKGVNDVLMDEFFNSKQKRFRMFCEQFLHNHLTDSVRNYMQIKK